MTRVALDYLLTYVICAAAMVMLARYIPALGSSSGAVTTVVAAMVAGQLYGRRTGEEVSSALAWRVAFFLAAISVAAAAGIAWGMGLLGRAEPGGVLMVFGFIGLLSLLAIRFTFRIATRQGARMVK